MTTPTFEEATRIAAIERKALKFNRCELEMIGMLANGRSQRDIAQRFHCTPAAVSKWLSQAKRYAEAATNEQLIAVAFRQGIIQ